MLSKMIPLALLAATLTSLGCHVKEKHSGDNEDVKIETPLGGMTVKTNDAVVPEVGLAIYPGASVVKKDKHNGAAGVEMNFGDFHLRFKVVSFRSADSPEKVTAFYRKELARFGDVIECRGNHPVGNPSKTREGLTCSNEGQDYLKDGDRHPEIELKAGGKVHQHIVAIETQPDGTKFGLVALDLSNGKKESN